MTDDVCNCFVVVALCLQPGQQQPRCVIPVLQFPDSPGTFPGLYAFSLHDQCWLDDVTLLVTSQWYSMTVILRVDVGSGGVVPVTPTDPTQGSWSLQVRGWWGGGDTSETLTTTCMRC